MRILWCSVVAVLLLLEGVVAPPVTANKKEDSGSEGNEVDGEHKGADWDIGLEYNRYLQEVVQALESDPEFREKLEKAEVADIRTGKIASELEFVSHNVRSKLDELKRQELERLRHLAIKQAELQRQQEHHNEDSDDEVEDPSHVDHENPHTFEVEDLKKLIVQTTKDLEEADRKRRDEFKEYEMQKEFEKHQQLNLLDEEHKKEMEKKIEEQEKKHKEHPNLHHPGSKSQLEEVWEEQDHMNPEDFNPKTFFHMHDLDGNGFWDADEVKALFQKELDKMYDPNAPEDDMRERREEMERMREHVFNETDVNKDRLISYQEFLDQTKKQEFDQDPGWDGLDKQEVYTHEEYQEFEKRRQAEVQQMIQQGLLPPAPDLHLPYGMQVPPEYMQQQHQQNLQYQQHHQIPPHAQAQYHPQQGGVPMHPGQVPQYQGGQGHPIPQPGHQMPPQGYHPPPPQYQQQHPNAVPNQQQYQNMPPQGQVHPGQGHPNQGQVHPNQVHPNQAQGYHPNEIPNQQQYQNQPPPGQVRQGQVHPNQAQGHPIQSQQYQNQPPNPQIHQNQPNAQLHQNQPNAQLHQNQPNAQIHQNQPNQVHQNQPNAQVYQNQPNAQIHQNQPNQFHQNQPNAQVHQNQPNQVHQNQPNQVHQNQPNAQQNQQPPVYQNPPVHQNNNNNAAPPPVHENQHSNNQINTNNNNIPSHDSGAGSQQH